MSQPNVIHRRDPVDPAVRRPAALPKPSVARVAVLAAAVGAFFAPIEAAEAQVVEANEGEQLTIQFDEIEGTALDEFIKLGEQLTGQQFTFDSPDTKDVRLRFLGRKTIERDQFWAYFQAVLRSRDFVVVPCGGPNAPGRPASGDGIGYFAIRRTSGGIGSKPGFIRSQAPVVSPEQLASFRNDAGLVVTTSFQLEFANAQEVVNMLQTYFSDPMVESVRAVNNTNSIVATGYATTLNGVADMLELVDVALPVPERRVERVELKNAVAVEIRPIVVEFLASERPPRGQPGVPMMALPNGGWTPDPVVEIDPRSNALLVLGTDTEHDRVRGYVEKIDVRVEGASSQSVVIALRHAVAGEVADLLRQLVRNTPATVVADERTNAIILYGPESKLTDLKAILARLDVATGDGAK